MDKKNLFCLISIFLLTIIGISSSPYFTFAKKISKKKIQEEVVIKVQRPKNPVMRVLLGDALSPTQFTANSNFVIEDTNNNQLFSLSVGEIVEIKYTKKGKYRVTSPLGEIISDQPVKITPITLNKKIQIINFENRPSWNTELNDNIFFGSVEVVYSATQAKPLLVNVIPIERYVRGIAEVTNDQHPEYLKALLTAARTYVLYNILHPTKHAGEPYILDATDNDQVYRGAGFSQRAPNAVAAQKATKGMVISYNDEPIIAPYFSRSDGRTRAWSEVWNGSYEWSISVDDPCCADKELWGHGVGLSGEGARYFAAQGWDWQTILKYYYSGVEIEVGY